MIDGYDLMRGVSIAGNRGYLLKDIGVQLNMALIQYSMDFMVKRDHTLLQPPSMLNNEPMSQIAQSEQFEEELYTVDCSSCTKYLISSAEQPVSAFHRGEWLDPKNLPLRYCCVSTCFRKEGTCHGRDTWLGIPYRVVNVASGALNNAAAKKYHLEGWFPASNNFRKLTSCTNYTDYQSRSLQIHFGIPESGEKTRFVHMLSSTLCASARTICVLIEIYQTPDGINIPEVLQPFIGGKKFLPFVIQEQDLPWVKRKGSNDTKVKGPDNNNV